MAVEFELKLEFDLEFELVEAAVVVTLTVAEPVIVVLFLATSPRAPIYYYIVRLRHKRSHKLVASLEFLSFRGVDAQLQPKAKHEIGRTSTTVTTTKITTTVMGLAGCCCSG